MYELKNTREKAILGDVYPVINWAEVSRRYFCRSTAWLYHKFNAATVNGKPDEFSKQDLEDLSSYLMDMSDKLRVHAEELRALAEEKSK